MANLDLEARKSYQKYYYENVTKKRRMEQKSPGTVSEPIQSDWEPAQWRGAIKRNEFYAKVVELAKNKNIQKDEFLKRLNLKPALFYNYVQYRSKMPLILFHDLCVILDIPMDKLYDYYEKGLNKTDNEGQNTETE